MRSLLAALILACCISAPQAAPNKFVLHMITVPLVEGTGIYTSAYTLKYSDRGASKAAAITDLSLLGTEATLGMLAKAGVGQGKLVKVHRVTSALLIAAGVWLAVSTSSDPATQGKPAQITGLFHPGFCTVPLIMYNF